MKNNQLRKWLTGIFNDNTENDQLQNWLIELLQTNEVSIKWNCGFDDAIIHVYTNTTPISDNLMLEKFEDFLIAILELPDAGEFKMTGEGSVYKKGDEIFISFQSESKDLVDFDEIEEKEIWENVVKKSGEIRLFE
jgi:hypothetical protein